MSEHHWPYCFMVGCRGGVFNTSHSAGATYTFNQLGANPVRESLKRMAAGGTLRRYMPGSKMIASNVAITWGLCDFSALIRPSFHEDGRGRRKEAMVGSVQRCG